MKVISKLLIVVFCVFYICNTNSIVFAKDKKAKDKKATVVKKEKVSEKEDKIVKETGLVSGTIIPKDTLKILTRYNDLISISKMKKLVIQADIEKNSMAWNAEFFIWLTANGVEYDNLKKWKVVKGKAVFTK